MNNITYIEIQASEPSALVDFYSKIFGWEFTKVEHPKMEMYSIAAGNLVGTLLQRPGQTPEKGHVTNTFMTGIEVESLEDTAKMITDNGGDVIMERMAIPGVGYRGYFRDADNNIFSLLQMDPEAK